MLIDVFYSRINLQSICKECVKGVIAEFWIAIAPG